MWTTGLRLRSGAEPGKICLLAALPLVASSSTCLFSFFVASSLVDTFFSTIARTPLSYLTTLAAENVFRFVEPSTHLPNSSTPTSSLVSLRRLLQKARIPGFPEHMRIGYRPMRELRCVGLSMFRGMVNGP
jgi:hypothetical protein